MAFDESVSYALGLLHWQRESHTETQALIYLYMP